MSETKFTPGPWQWDTYNDVLAEGGIIVAHTYDHPTNDPEDYPADPIENAKARSVWYAQANANAHLIAAAPDLYAALTDMFALIDEGWLVRQTNEDHKPAFAVRMLPFVARMQKAQAALSKARNDQ
jgi:hypothetical protein